MCTSTNIKNSKLSSNTVNLLEQRRREDMIKEEYKNLNKEGGRANINKIINDNNIIVIDIRNPLFCKDLYTSKMPNPNLHDINRIITNTGSAEIPEIITKIKDMRDCRQLGGVDVQQWMYEV